MISKKEWENVVGDKMSDVVAKYNASVSCVISSKVKRAPREEEAAEKEDNKGDRGYGVYGKDGGEIRFSPKDMGYKKNKESKNDVIAYLVADNDDSLSVFPVAKGDESDVYAYGLDEIKIAYKFVNMDNKIVINDKWNRFQRLSKEENRILKEARGE